MGKGRRDLEQIKKPDSTRVIETMGLRETQQKENSKTETKKRVEPEAKRVESHPGLTGKTKCTKN